MLYLLAAAMVPRETMEETMFAGFALRSTNSRMVKYFHSELENIREKKKSTQGYVQSGLKQLKDGVYFPFEKPSSYASGYGAIKRLFPDAANYVKGKSLRGQTKEFTIVGHKTHEDVTDERLPGEEEPMGDKRRSIPKLASAVASASPGLGLPSPVVSAEGERKPEIVSYLMLQNDKLLKQRGTRYRNARVFENRLGSGSFACVYGPVKLLDVGASRLARDGSVDSVVVKTTPVELKNHIRMAARGPGTEYARAHEECVLLDMFRDHPNIVRVRDVFLVDLALEEDHKTTLCLGLVLEHYGNTCDRCITGSSSNFLRHEVRCVVSDILSALSYVHSWRIIHADVKPNNILFVQDELCEVGQQGIHAKLCDFNSSLQAMFDSRFLVIRVPHGPYGSPMGFMGSPWAPWGPCWVFANPPTPYPHPDGGGEILI